MSHTPIDTDTLAGLRDDLRNPLGPIHSDGHHHVPVWVIDLTERAANAIDALSTALAASRAGEEALAKALREIANCGQSAEPDHWKFRCMAREKARAILAAAEKDAQG